MSLVQDEQRLLRDVMHIIATTPEPTHCFPHILEIACKLIDAQWALVLLFEEPRMLSTCGFEAEEVPDGEVFRQLAETLPDKLDIVQKTPAEIGIDGKNLLAAPLRLQDEVVGVVLFSLDYVPGVELVSNEALETIIYALTIVTRSARSEARHAKLSRNQSEFMRIVSHDLRSPLTSMKGFGSMLESSMVGDLNERQAHFVNKILAGITQMTSLVDNIQDAGRYDPETGFYEMQRTPCDITEMVQRIINNHLVPAEKQELTIHSNIADNIPILSADVTMLERAITNLVDNAIKYTPNGSQVTVNVYREDDDVFVSVQDSGFGISPENQRMLFERHVRIPRKEHKKIKGTGLGLFIVRSVARRHGGEAWVESVEGEGSTFYIRLPLNGSNSIVG